MGWIAPVFLLIAFTVIVCTLVYVFSDQAKIKAANEKERQQVLDQFPALLAAELKRCPEAEFNYYEFAHSCEVSSEDAQQIAVKLYTKLTDQVLADGVLTPGERKKLDRFGRALKLDPEIMRKTEEATTAETYRKASTLARSSVTASGGVVRRFHLFAASRLPIPEPDLPPQLPQRTW